MDKMCKYCSMMIPKTARVCPYCRKSQGWTTGAKIGLIIIILILFGAIFMIGYVANKPSPNSDEEIAKIIYYSMQDRISSYLKAPATAKFPYYDKSFVKIKKKDEKTGIIIFTINSYVDAENSFGALLRNHYKCDVMYDPRPEAKGKELHLLNIKFR